jgi:hypothetical protein
MAEILADGAVPQESCRVRRTRCDTLDDCFFYCSEDVPCFEYTRRTQS